VSITESPRRAAILEAALAAFVDKGLDGASIADVRRASGASVGSIYHHFGGKEGMVSALYLDALTDYQEGFRDALRDAPDARAGIEAAVAHHVRWVTARPAAARFLLMTREHESLAGARREVRRANRRFFAEVQGWLDPHVRAGTLRDLTLELFEALLLGPSQEYTRHWLADRAPTAPTEAESTLAEAAWNSGSTTKGDSR
jgi:AcrR family transcriptional regulator